MEGFVLRIAIAGGVDLHESGRWSSEPVQAECKVVNGKFRPDALCEVVDSSSFPKGARRAFDRLPSPCSLIVFIQILVEHKLHNWFKQFVWQLAESCEVYLDEQGTIAMSGRGPDVLSAVGDGASASAKSRACLDYVAASTSLARDKRICSIAGDASRVRLKSTTLVAMAVAPNVACWCPPRVVLVTLSPTPEEHVLSESVLTKGAGSRVQIVNIHLKHVSPNCY